MALNLNTIRALLSAVSVLAGAFGQEQLAQLFSAPEVASVVLLVAGLFGLAQSDKLVGSGK